MLLDLTKQPQALFIIYFLGTTQRTTRWNTDKYECFSDNGQKNNYKELDLNYENSIFILNVREMDKWLISRFKHGLRKKHKPNWAYPYTCEKCIE